MIKELLKRININAKYFELIIDGILQPTSGYFISRNDMTSASSVSTSLKALADKEMIVFDRDKRQVYDVFLSRWLEYHYKD